MAGTGGNGGLETAGNIAERDIYDEDGVLLVAKGKEITPQVYRRLLERKVALERRGTEITSPPPPRACKRTMMD
ncbi:hypothetical protein TcarDRAFT_0873 [Thermosinus carboxydivorans Nor1]|uniref:Uncharacterized protein n=1 Tax=Thermosinus carboxydivorans Nor1 TaxID=401526 RepID=A1HSJ9_9FIRM|nr:hypothetical protein [Thermosinus carboxydivorans]EAX46971.1 hypothetical protein TcarDRAFT_0873 [Thermosinus carboxydivorans Nor1]